MRIISQFCDYYDCIQKTSQDRETIFFRKEIITYYKYINYEFNTSCCGTVPFAWRTHKFVFCNKPYINHQIINLNHRINLPDFWCRTSQEAKDYIKDHIRKKLIEKHSQFFKGDYKQRAQDLYLEKFLSKKYNFNEPIIIYPDDLEKEKIINGKLEDFEFQKIKDPYTAFQEIYQFISNRANPEPYIPELTDKEKIISKSFDIKHSFRNTK